MPITAKEMINKFKKLGYKIIKSAGKGSHIKMRKGSHTVIIPNHGELKKGLEKALLKELKKG